MQTDIQRHIIGPDGRPILDAAGPLPDGARLRVPVVLMDGAPRGVRFEDAVRDVPDGRGGRVLVVDSRTEVSDGWPAAVFKAAGIGLRARDGRPVRVEDATPAWDGALARMRQMRGWG